MAKTLDGIFRFAASAVLFALAASSVHAASECDPMPKADSEIAGATKIAVPGQKPTAVAGEKPTTQPLLSETVALRDWVAITVTHLDVLLRQSRCSKPIIVYLNGQPMKGLTLSTGAIKDEAYFQLIRANIDR